MSKNDCLSDERLSVGRQDVYKETAGEDGIAEWFTLAVQVLFAHDE